MKGEELMDLEGGVGRLKKAVLEGGGGGGGRKVAHETYKVVGRGIRRR